MLFRRILTYVTLVSCLVVGTLVVRSFQTTTAEISLPLPAIEFLVSHTEMPKAEASAELEEITFAQMEFAAPEEVKPVKRIARQKAPVPVKTPAPQLVSRSLEKFELPFNEPVQLNAVYFDGNLPIDLFASYKPFSMVEEVMVAKDETVVDEVKTAQAQVAEVDADPLFFEYEEISDAKEVPTKTEEVTKVAQVEEHVLLPTDEMKNQPEIPVSEEVSLFELISGSAPEKNEAAKNADSLMAGTLVAPVTTQKKSETPKWQVTQKSKKVSKQKSVTTQNAVTSENDDRGPEYSSLMGPASSLNVIRSVGTNLNGYEALKNFEVRFHDNFSEMQSDYGSGEISLTQALSLNISSRSVRLLKPGFIPTNGEALLELSGSGLTIPMIVEDTFNELQGPYEASGPIGAVLVRLDEESELAQLDVPFVKVLTLDENLRVTTKDNHQYQLFVGVQAGNALLTYKRFDGQDVSKVIHVHEREVTFDYNLFEINHLNQISLYEDDLLSKEKAPLVVSSHQVKQFATGKNSRKTKNNTFVIDSKFNAMGGRQYLELTHQSEPVFVGIRNNSKVNVPSENLMRFLLSKFENSKLGNRCLIQVNLSKKVAGVEVGTQSVDDTLQTYVQMLDSDGRFYDSPSEKTIKLIVLGESHADAKLSPDGVVNFKLTYSDGTQEFLSSYCSPNSYMVEQL